MCSELKKQIRLSCKLCDSFKIVDSLPEPEDIGEVLGCGHELYEAMGTININRLQRIYAAR